MNMIYEFLLEKGVNPDIILDMDSNEFFDMMRYLKNKNNKTSELTDEQQDMIQDSKDDKWWVGKNG